LNFLSFLAFHIYHKIYRILTISSSVVCGVIMVVRMAWTPSSSYGSEVVLMEGLAVNQTALGRLHRKNKWASFSKELQSEHTWQVLEEYAPALLPVAKALLISLHVNF
jgi:hypothetical protein